jgi:hypothetical protein
MAPTAPGLELLVRRVFFLLGFLLIAATPRAGASDADRVLSSSTEGASDSRSAKASAERLPALTLNDASASPTAAASADQRRIALADIAPAAKDAPRPAALMPLYLSLAALQVVDLHSTAQALSAGGRESNPVAGAFVGSQAGFTVMKIASTAGIIVLTERLRKHHPAAAMLLMIGLDSAYAGVAAHNYGIRTAGAVR